MGETKAAMSLGIAAAMLLMMGACSDDPVAPAPVLLMGRTTAAAQQPAISPAHPQVMATAPASMMQPGSPTQHHASPPAVAEKKNHGKRVVSHPAHHRTYHAAHASRIAATAKRPEQIPLDEPVMAPAYSASPGSTPPISRQPATSWVSPPPAEASQAQFRPPSP